MTPIPPIPDPVERYAQLLDCGKSHLAGELVRAEQRIAKLTAENNQLNVDFRQADLDRKTWLEAHRIVAKRNIQLEAENTRLKAPVSQEEKQKHFFILESNREPVTSAARLEAILAARATRTPPQEGQ